MMENLLIQNTTVGTSSVSHLVNQQTNFREYPGERHVATTWYRHTSFYHTSLYCASQMFSFSFCFVFFTN